MQSPSQRARKLDLSLLRFNHTLSRGVNELSYRHIINTTIDLPGAEKSAVGVVSPDADETCVCHLERITASA